LPETNAATKASAPALRIGALVLLAIVALGVYAFDQLTKLAVTTNLTEGETVSVIGQILQFHYIKNSGAAFSLGEGMTWIFSIVATAVAVFILVFARRIRSLGWAALFGMLLGGNLGNLTDRLFREPSFGQGHVIDFLQIWGFPAIFNIADVAIVASMGLFILLTLRGVGLDGTRESTAKASDSDSDADADAEASTPSGTPQSDTPDALTQPDNTADGKP
jgi:signal peptidase II